MRKIQRIPFSTARASRQGRPRPSERRFAASRGLTFSHCASVRSMLWIYATLHNSQAPNGLNVYELSGTSARLAGRLKNTWARKGHTLTLEDTIVAAIAIEQKCALLTDNRKDFPMPDVELYPVPRS